MSTVSPPLRPFARRESPASSTGDSSSGKAPLTPRDGSSTYSGPSAVNTNRRPGTHGRKPSITFEDEQDGNGKEKQNDTNADEARRKERRRSEARAAIELGNVVNGPPPVDYEDEVALGQQQGIHGGWPQPNMQFPMQIPMPPMPPMFPMGMGMQSPGAYGFNYPPHAPTADPAFLAAHQQAMAIAKQTFQYAVAQQALAAANEEWERNSTMTGYGGPAPTPQWGYGMGMRQSGMFTPSPRSMYAGSVSGGGGGWGGTGSAYGNSFGPVAAGGRNSIYSQGDRAVPVQRPARPRTKTAPSATSPPNGTLISRIPAPPSSFRGTGR
ncbi:hypothetical protein K439DRAFT_328331 [Ramaria rubella]|nr:hypothetical protein K439DRAFT_328331 [Ramaria rubella]